MLAVTPAMPVASVKEFIAYAKARPNALNYGSTGIGSTANMAGALTSLPHIRSGRIKALAVTTPRPSLLMPDVPPLASLYPGFQATNWYGIFAPAGTPAAVVNKLNQEMARAIQLPDVREFMAREGADPVGSTPQEFARFFKSEVDRYAQVIRAANIRVE